MNHTDTVRPLQERVATIRRMLSRSATMDAALSALSIADYATLRVIETDFYHQPAPILQLREQIAQAHIGRIPTNPGPHARTESPAADAAWAVAGEPA